MNTRAYFAARAIFRSRRAGSAPTVAAVLLLAGLPALAQDSPETLKSQEQWLRYSNWEQRSTRPGGWKGTSSKPVTPPKDEQTKEENASKLPLPDRPGSQTVEGGQFSIPGWAFQQPQQAQRPPEFFMGQPLGMPGYQSRPGFFAATGYLGGGFLGGRGPCFRQSRLGPQVIQTGPSHPSGNYYQPSTADPGSSGGYYASGTPWQVPLNGANNPSDYWGPQGNPFASK